MPKLSMKRTKSMKLPRGGVKKTSRKSLRRGVKLTKSKKPLRGGIKRKKSRRVLLRGGAQGPQGPHVQYTHVVFPKIDDNIHPASADAQALLPPGGWLVRYSATVPGALTVLVKTVGGEVKIARLGLNKGETVIAKAWKVATQLGAYGAMVMPELLVKPKQEDLLKAVMDGNLEEVTRLADRGADLNKESRNGWTALMWAAHKGHHPVAEFLLKHGAHPNAANKSGETPLHVAAYYGHTGICKLLLKYNADINAKDKQMQTPLHEANRMNHKETSDFLKIAPYTHPVSADEQALLRPKDWMVRESATEPGKYTVVVKMWDGVVGKARLENVQDHEAKRIAAELLGIHLRDVGDMVKPKLLLEAVKSGKLPEVKRLVKLGTDPNEADAYDYTALHYASIFGNPSIVKFLLEKGAKINERTHDTKSTPLHYAAANGMTEAVKVLIDAGADVNAKNNKWFTPLVNASKQGWSDTVEVLKNARGRM